jgi:hypothetical protein
MKEEVFSVRILKNRISATYVIKIVSVLCIHLFLLYLGLSLTDIVGRVTCLAIAFLVALAMVYGLGARYYPFDDKTLFISKNGIGIDADFYDWSVIEKLGIYTDGFFEFKYRNRFGLKLLHTGDNSQIYFRTGERKFNYRFVIPNKDLFLLLNDIMADWKDEKRPFVSRASVSWALLEKNSELNQSWREQQHAALLKQQADNAFHGHHSL